jgi:hypothetical protein
MRRMDVRRISGLAGAAALLLSVTTYAAGQSAAAPEARDAVVQRAKVWMPIDTATLDLKAGPAEPGAFRLGETITCKYLDKKLSGMSPKFACVTADGDELKVKYGGANGEIYGEVMSSRLLWALGFAADRMYSVRVICQGCPSQIGGIVRENGDRILDPAAVERKFGGDELFEGWKWEELEKVDEESGGATRAERDALKLLAVFLQHSDSKAQNQRIVCIEAVASGQCSQPIMMINDLGVTWGKANRWNQQPRGSVNLAEWEPIPIWRDATGCVGNLSGSFTGTLKNPVISEEGRQFLADLLTKLSDDQLRGMFEAARIHLRARAPESARSGLATVDEWVMAFKAKRAQITERTCA